MKEWLDKIDEGGPHPDSTAYVNSAEINSVGNELINLVTGTGQSLSTIDKKQVSKSISSYSSLFSLLIDTGSSNNYNLNHPGEISEVGTLIDGMRFRFNPLNNNTSGSVNITYNGLTKSAVAQDGNTLSLNEIRLGRECEIQWDASGDRWVVRNSGEEWRAIPLSAGWQIYGFPWEEPEVCKIGSVVFLRGLTRNGTTSDGTVIGTLPINFRPIERLMFAGLHSTSASHRLDVAPTGELLITGVTSNAYLSLSGTFFSVE